MLKFRSRFLSKRIIRWKCQFVKTNTKKVDNKIDYLISFWTKRKAMSFGSTSERFTCKNPFERFCVWCREAFLHFSFDMFAGKWKSDRLCNFHNGPRFSRVANIARVCRLSKLSRADLLELFESVDCVRVFGRNGHLRKSVLIRFHFDGGVYVCRPNW